MLVFPPDFRSSDVKKSSWSVRSLFGIGLVSSSCALATSTRITVDSMFGEVSFDDGVKFTTSDDERLAVFDVRDMLESGNLTVCRRLYFADVYNVKSFFRSFKLGISSRPWKSQGTDFTSWIVSDKVNDLGPQDVEKYLSQ